MLFNVSADLKPTEVKTEKSSGFKVDSVSGEVTTVKTQATIKWGTVTQKDSLQDQITQINTKLDDELPSWKSNNWS